MSKTKEYRAQARLNILVTKTINAANLGEAVEKANKLQETDFIEFIEDDGYLDGEFNITGVYESNG